MPVKWKNQKKFKPSVVLDRIEKLRSVNDDGSVSFQTFSFEQDSAALFSMLEFPDAAADMNKMALVRAAIFSSRPTLTPDNFIAAINKKLSANLSKKEVGYCLLATVSMDSNKWPNAILVGDAKVRFFGRHFPNKYADRQRVISSESRGLELKDSPSTYCAIGVDVSAKSEEMAVNKAMRAIDLLRGMMCMDGNLSLQFILSGTDYVPINVIRFGSFHTLHWSDGSSANDCLWYEPEYRQANIFAFKELDNVRKNIRFALGRLFKSAFGEVIRESVVRYVRALDEPNPNTAFLRLWGAFEMLLTPGKADYDLLIERCCFFYKDADYSRQVLMHLRECRNSSVHAGHENSEARTNCYILQKYYIHLFWFLVHNSLRYQSLVEIHQLLDSPRDAVALKRAYKILGHAVSFRSR